MRLVLLFICFYVNLFVCINAQEQCILFFAVLYKVQSALEIMEDLCACPSYFHSKAILHVCSLTLHEREFLPFSSNHLLISSSSEIEILRACLEQRLFHILKEFMHVKRHKINCIKLFSLLLITQLLLLVIDGYLIFGLSSNVGRLK